MKTKLAQRTISPFKKKKNISEIKNYSMKKPLIPFHISNPLQPGKESHPKGVSCQMKSISGN
jgi:hypothetical protein